MGGKISKVRMKIMEGKCKNSLYEINDHQVLLSQQVDASKYQILARFNLFLIILRVTEEISVFKNLHLVTLLFLVLPKLTKVWWQQSKPKRVATHLKELIINATRHLKNKDWARTMSPRNMSRARTSRIQSSSRWTRVL